MLELEAVANRSLHEDEVVVYEINTHFNGHGTCNIELLIIIQSQNDE